MRRARFERERESLFLRLGEVIRESLAADRIPAIDDALEVAFEQSMIGEFTDTREMRFYLGSVEAITPSLIERIQELLRTAFKTWSVVPQYGGCNFTIHADRVEFADSRVKTGSNRCPELDAWRASAIAERDKSYGPLRRELAALRPLVRSSLLDLKSEQAVILLAAHRINDSTRVLWLLESPMESSPGSLTLLPEATFPYAPESYPVDRAGVVHPRFSDIPVVAWLLAFNMEGVPPDRVQVHRLNPPCGAAGTYTGVATLGDHICELPLPKFLDS